MTREELYTKANGLMIPQPFAAGDASHLPSFTPILNEINGSDVNFIEGFTAAFSAPSSAGGRYVTRKEMNAIGHLASANWFKLMCGGIFTFDADLATRIGGYPKGAVLDYLDGLNYYRVVSLIDNNMVNFLGIGPTGTQQTVAGSVDGVNWQFCERGFVSEPSNEPIIIGPVGVHEASMIRKEFFIADVIPSRNGVLSFRGNYSYENTDQAVGYIEIKVYDVDSSGEIIDSSGKVIFHAGVNMSDPVYIKSVNPGSKYRVVLFAYHASFNGPNFNLVIL